MSDTVGQEAMTCSGCGAALPADARYCARCGLSVDLLDESRSGRSAPTPSSWLSTVDETESRVRRNTGRPRSIRTILALGFAVLAAVVIALGVARAPTTGLTGLADELAGPTTSSVGDGAADNSTGSGGIDAVDGADAVAIADLGELDPALTDYRLFASRSSELIEIDLATGQIATHEVAGRLIGFFDDRLFLVDPAIGISAIPVGSPEEDPETIITMEPNGSEVASAVVDDDGVLYVTIVEPSGDSFGSSMIRLDLTTEQEQRIDVSSVAAMGLVEVPGGGLFELTEDGFRSLTDASVRFFGLSYVLAERCDDPEQCRRFWLQRSTGVRVTRPLPGLQVGYVLGRTGRVAVGVEPGHVGFFDVRLAAEISIEDHYRDVDEPWFVIEDVTEDDRFLAAVVGEVGSDVVVHDLDTRNEVRFELGRSSPLSKLLFVSRGGRP